MPRRRLCSLPRCCLLLAASPAPAAAADSHNCSPEQVRALITLLKSNGPKADKALACKKLAIFGGKDAVPALAPLLTDPELASWARIALEAIPGPAADAALRNAMDKVQGRVLVGVINSIAVRRDPKAVSGLVKKLKATDPDSPPPPRWRWAASAARKPPRR